MAASFEKLPGDKAAAIVKAGVEEFSARSYSDANTDRITEACGISKGLLYHYFGTKKAFYLYCLRHCLEVLTKAEECPPEGDFYAVLFAAMERKMQLCAAHPAETKLLNMASREFSSEVRAEKDALIAEYAGQIRLGSERVMDAALSALPIKAADAPFAARGLTLYTNALINRYLLIYQENPDGFFANKETIKEELKAYIDLMLYGVCEAKA